MPTKAGEIPNFLKRERERIYLEVEKTVTELRSLVSPNSGWLNYEEARDKIKLKVLDLASRIGR